MTAPSPPANAPEPEPSGGARLSTTQAARVLGLRAFQVRALARRLLGRDGERGRPHRFDFRDLVVLRSAAELLKRRVPAARVTRALRGLRSRLPQDKPLSGVRIYAEGARIAVREDGRSWDPVTGQLWLELGPPLAPPGVVPAHPEGEPGEARSAPRESGAALGEFERALELEESDPEAARRAYARALELDPDLAEAYINLGRLAHEADRLAEAIQLYQQALERRSDDPVIYFNLALATEDHSGPERAVGLYHKALALDPEFADAHYNLANVLERLGRRPEALRHYRVYRRLTAER